MFNRYRETEKKKAKDILCLAWYTEALHRTKKLPKLEGLLKDKKKEMSDEEMLNAIKSLNTALGGEVIGNS